MLEILKDIFDKKTIEINSSGERTELHSHTSMNQGLFLQEVLEDVKPAATLEIGLAYGISSMFILEKLKEFGNAAKSHIIVEPYPWNGVAEYNIEKAGLSYLTDYRYKKSDEVLPPLYYEKHEIQFAYVDTTKLFDVVLTDFYFIDKILVPGGVIVLDDCGGGWPGVQRVARFVNSLPHYELYKQHSEVVGSAKRNAAQSAVESLIAAIPYKGKFFAGHSFLSDRKLGLNFQCLAFRKKHNDERPWSADFPF